jgi:hypothetical protein
MVAMRGDQRLLLNCVEVDGAALDGQYAHIFSDGESVPGSRNP